MALKHLESEAGEPILPRLALQDIFTSEEFTGLKAL